MSLSELWDEVVAHFSTSSSLSRVQVMTKAASQTEGWWKSEMMFLLERLQEGGVIESWDSEVSIGIGRRKVDLEVRLRAKTAIVELKTAFCGVQKGTLWKLSSYVMGPRSGFILTDILKLAAVKETHNVTLRYLLIFAYPAPPQGDWQVLIQAVSRMSPEASVSLVHMYEDVAVRLSIGWLKVG